MGQIKLNCGFESLQFLHLNHVLMLNWIVWNKTDFTFNSVYCITGWSCRIHQLYLCRGVRCPPPKSSLDMTLNNLMVRFQWCWSFGECGVPLHCHHSQGWIKINCVLMLNWITWNRTVLIFKLHTYDKLNCLKWNCFLHYLCVKNYTYAKLNCLN